MAQVEQPVNLQMNAQMNNNGFEQQNNQAPVVEHREIEIQTTPRNDENEVNGFPNGSNTPDNDRIHRNNMMNQSGQKSTSNLGSLDNTGYKENLNPNQIHKSTLNSPDLQEKSSQFQPKKPCERCKLGIPERDLRQRKKEVAILKSQNDRLINNLRDMSIQLDQTLEKVKLKNYEKPVINYESSREVNEKELENAKQQIEFYNKQLSQYASQEEDCSSKRMGQWHSAVKEIENELADCKILNKNLLYIKREQERTMLQNKDAGKLKILRDDVLVQKNLLRDAQKQARENEKGFKKTQEHTNKLKQRHQEVCTQFGVPFSPFESLPKETKLELLIHEKNEQNEVLATYRVNEESTLKMQQDIKIIEDSLKTIRKQGKTEQKAVMTRVKQVEEQRDSLIASISKKDKEIQETFDKLNTLKQIFSNSQQIGFSESSKPHKSSSVLNIAPYVKKYKETRKEIKGLLGGSGINSQSFEDSTQLPDTKDQAISQINFWFVDDMIMGLETAYQLSNGEIQSVCSFDAGPKKDLMKQSTLTFYGTEYISQVEGFYNFHCLEFLRIQTSRGNVLEVGSKRNLARCKRFSYEIRKNEIPVAFLGSTDLPFLKKDERIKDYGKPEVRQKFKDCPVLVNFGIEVRKKDVYQEPLKNIRPLTGSENQIGKLVIEERRRVSGEERQSSAYNSNNNNNFD